MGDRDYTRLPTVPSPGSAKINATQNQEKGEHAERKKGEKVVIEKPMHSTDNKKLHMAVVQTTTPFMVYTSLPAIADLDSTESNTIDQKESRDAVPQISSEFPGGTSSIIPSFLQSNFTCNQNFCFYLFVLRFLPNVYML